MNTPNTIPADILEAYDLADGNSSPVVMGNINATFRVKANTDTWMVQRLNPLFSERIHLDIEAITAHLEGRGVLTPRLKRNSEGQLWTRDADGGVWRVLNAIPGDVHQHGTPVLCEEAGAFLGTFHATLADLDHTFHAKRLGVHDTEKHLANLDRALSEHTDHASFQVVEPIGSEILSRSRSLPSLTSLRERLVHGDPKLNNFIFSPEGKALCLIDLDTLASMPVPLELGDAMRSWCNHADENEIQSTFVMEHFERALTGYRRGTGDMLQKDEIEALVDAVETITLELAARFCADALQESYFGWDHRLFESASEHHFVRAQGQLNLAKSFAEQRSQAQGIVDRLW